jgi:hypothetical protein
MGRRGMDIGYWWEKPERKRPRRRWNNSKTDLGEAGWGGRALIKVVMNLRVL